MIKLATSITQLKALGYPDIYAKILIRNFGKNAYLLARWMKEYFSMKSDAVFGNDTKFVNRIAGGLSDYPAYLEMHTAALLGEDAYDSWAKDNGHAVIGSEYGPWDLNEHIKLLEKEVEKEFLNSIFFNRDLIKDIVSGDVKDLSKYKKMSYADARDSWAETDLIKNKGHLIRYDNGYRWLDMGRNCDYIGKYMKNCGSTGAMSADEDKSMITLVDEFSKPHIVLTFSPNEKRVSGIEGVASSAPKEVYHQYIIDIIDHLSVEYSEKGAPKSGLLFLKYKLKNLNAKIDKIPSDYKFSEYFEVNIDGSIFYTDLHFILSKSNAEKILKNLLESNYNMPFVDMSNPSLYDALPYILPEKAKRVKNSNALGINPYIYLGHFEFEKLLLDSIKSASPLLYRLIKLSNWLKDNNHKEASLSVLGQLYV